MSKAGNQQGKWTRRSREAWQALLNRFDAQHDSVSAFCARESISEASYYRWRGLFHAALHEPAAPSGPSAFLDLGPIPASQPASQPGPRHDLNLDPTNGHLYVFINRRATQIKVLYWDRTGFCVWAKRLESGCFISDWSKAKAAEMDWTGLKLLLEGIEPARFKKRYKSAQNRTNS